MRRTARQRGFTLVEVLIVLGILMCLVGIMLPAIARAREEGRKAQCLANLGQLTIAWNTYAVDNERRICPSGQFVGQSTRIAGLQAGLLWMYLQEDRVYRCPDDQMHVSKDFYLNSYQINGVLPSSLDKLDQASKTFVFIEGWTQNGKMYNAFGTPVYPANVFSVGGIPGQNHHGALTAATGTGISFADGHAIFWQYTDPRVGNLAEFIGGGGNRATAVAGGKTITITVGVAVNSPDLYQLEAWSGGQVPPNATH